MRDRLIELIGEAKAIEASGIDCKVTYEYIADHLIANGVLVPPCKVGATVYEIQPLRNRIQPYEVITVKYNGHFWYMLWKLKNDEGIYGNLEGFVDTEIGETVFLTREEAERVLEKGGVENA